MESPGYRDASSLQVAPNIISPRHEALDGDSMVCSQLGLYGQIVGCLVWPSFVQLRPFNLYTMAPPRRLLPHNSKERLPTISESMRSHLLTSRRPLRRSTLSITERCMEPKFTCLYLTYSTTQFLLYTKLRFTSISFCCFLMPEGTIS